MIGLLCVAAGLGCVKSEGAQVKQRVEAVQQEQSWEKLYAQGRAFAAVGDLTRAEQYMAAALDAGGDGKKILPSLMGVCVEAKKYRVAIDYGEAYVKKKPDTIKLRHLLGTLYLALGEVAPARHHFEAVLERRPDEAETHYALGVLHRDSDHDPVRADKHFRAYLRINPTGAHVEDARASLLRSVP